MDKNKIQDKIENLLTQKKKDKNWLFEIDCLLKELENCVLSHKDKKDIQIAKAVINQARLMRGLR